MNLKVLGSITLVSFALCLNLGMGRQNDYDLEADTDSVEIHEKKQFQNPATGIAKGIKAATVDTTTGLVRDTAEGSKDGIVTGTLEGARKGTEKVVDGAIRGVATVATLGQTDGSNYEITPPEANTAGQTTSGYDSTDADEKSMTKVTFKIPGT